MPHKIPLSVYWNDEEALKDMIRFEPLKNVKNIMITGGAGFIGSWVTRSLTLLYPEYHIVCFDNLDICSSLNNIRVLDERSNFSFVRGDITNYADVEKCLGKHHIDIIFHFAAQSHVDLSFDAPQTFCNTNFNGTLTLLEASRTYGIEKFIHVSTDEVYGEILPGGSDHVEGSPLIPTNPYSASKAAAEMMVTAYTKSFNLPVITVRSNNVYGPNQFPEKVIPKFAALLLRGEKVPLYGSGNYTRRCIYAGDVANAFNVIMHRGVAREIYNIGTYDEISNIELSSGLLRLAQHTFAMTNFANDTGDWIQLTEDRPFMDRRYGVDFSKLKALGWVQKVDLDEGFKRTVDWYRKYGETWWGDVSAFLEPGQFMHKRTERKSSSSSSNDSTAVVTPIRSTEALTILHDGLKASINAQENLTVIAVQYDDVTKTDNV